MVEVVFFAMMDGNVVVADLMSLLLYDPPLTNHSLKRLKEDNS